MVNENLINLIENKKPVEIVQELKDEYKIPSFEEFMKDYKVDKLVSGSYELEIDNYDNIGVPKACGSMYRFNRALSVAIARRQVSSDIAMRVMELMADADNSDDLQRQIDRTAYNIRNDINVSVNINIYNIIVQIVREEDIRIIIPTIVSLPSINNVTFNTTGSTRPDNYRGVGTVLGGFVGNIIGGLIEDSSRNKASGVLFASNRRNPLSFWSFYETGTMDTTVGNRVDFHDDKIVCRSKENLTELKSKIGNIVEVFEWKFARVSNRTDKEREFKDTVQNLLDRHDRGRDINGHHTI